jgi:hypothetical protein
LPRKVHASRSIGQHFNSPSAAARFACAADILAQQLDR